MLMHERLASTQEVGNISLRCAAWAVAYRFAPMWHWHRLWHPCRGGATRRPLSSRHHPSKGNDRPERRRVGPLLDLTFRSAGFRGPKIHGITWCDGSLGACHHRNGTGMGWISLG